MGFMILLHPSEKEEVISGLISVFAGHQCSLGSLFSAVAFSLSRSEKCLWSLHTRAQF